MTVSITPSSSLCGVDSVGSRKNLIAPFPIDRTLAILSNQKSIGIHIGTPIGNQANPILIHKVIRRLNLVRHVMNVFDAVDQVGKWFARYFVDFAQVKDRLNLAVVYLAPRIVV